MRGVIGPEVANNACRGGDLILTLLFGIPGSSSMAIMLIALIMFGIFPGPDMMTKNLDIVFMIVWSLVIANIVGGVICMFLSRPLSQITKVPVNILGPFVIIIIVMGALQWLNNWGDLITLLALGFLGWTMKQTGFGRPPLIVGFVLGGLAETYLGISIHRFGMAWLWRPWVIVIGMLTIATVFFGIRWQRRQSEVQT